MFSSVVQSTRIRHIQEHLDNDNNEMGLKVIGAGFGRTGTLSTMTALEELGFTKCHHMKSVFQNPEQRHVFLEASNGGTPDWDKLYERYQAAVDFPSSLFYKELMAKYPDAKVLLNVRDPEKWYESVKETIFKLSTDTENWKNMQHLVPQIAELNKMVRKLIWEDLFKGRFEEKEFAIKVFNDHIEEVKKFVPKDKLLVFSVKDGWKPLCEFLGVEVPDTPFLHVNQRAASTAEQFQKMAAALNSTPSEVTAK